MARFLTGQWHLAQNLHKQDALFYIWRFIMKFHDVSRLLPGMMFLIALLAGLPQTLPAQHNHDHAPNAVTVTGKNICIGCSLKKSEGAKAQCKAYGCRHGLRVEKITGPHGEDRSRFARIGTVLHYLDNDRSNDLISGNHGQSVIVTGRVYAQEHIFDVASFKVMKEKAAKKKAAKKEVEAPAGKTESLAAIFSKDSCCAKAYEDGGKACTHPCCVKAAAADMACEKCNPGSGERQKLETAARYFTEDSCCAKAYTAGKPCTHGCCVQAIAAGKPCAGCNPGGVERQNMDSVSKSFTEGGCCAKAYIQGRVCSHPCCSTSIAKGEACSKCNPA